MLEFTQITVLFLTLDRMLRLCGALMPLKPWSLAKWVVRMAGEVVPLG